MKASTILDAVTALLVLLRNAVGGDAKALERLKDVLPARTYTQIAREGARAKDRAKYGR